MMDAAMILENVARIRETMAQAARAAGRAPEEIRLCAATKMNDAEAVRAAIAAGVDCCGENRVQELQQKLPLGAYEGRPLHFIGRLQTNKVKYLVGTVDMIESVDRVALLEVIDKLARKRGVRQDILLEVNIAGQESKAGFTADEARQVAEKMAEYPGVRLCGLMAIPPVSEKMGDNRIFFRQMRQLFVDIKAKRYDNIAMECLSMGMSDDYPDAIAEGSTMIRVGTAIFGARHYA